MLIRERFQTLFEGARTDLFTLTNPTNRHGMVVKFTNLGAKIVQILVPDRAGVLGDVVLGVDNIADVIAGPLSMGAFIGRYAGRIGNARFTLDGRTHALTANAGAHCLHGGARGSRVRMFDVQQVDASSARLALTFADGEDGFPGELKLALTYEVTADNALRICFTASTDQPTVASFTSHCFFNLAGHRRSTAQTLRDHVLTLHADQFTPTDAELIPTGVIQAVANTPLDFRQPTRIGARAAAYDHNWLCTPPAGALREVAVLEDPLSGRILTVLSRAPGLVFYDGHNLPDLPNPLGKGGAPIMPGTGLCLEPGECPDAPNHANFPSTVLRPGEVYRGEIVYRFSVRA